MSLQLSIDESWTLFLDRDGVINRKLEGDYVKTWEEFEFLPDVQRTIRYLSAFFGRVVVVTNQQGVGKELMTKHDLHDIHDKMLAAIEEEGGSIDRVYYCPDLEEDESPCRKPEIGMAMWAKRDFPEIDFSKSIMIGDSMTDLQFGANLGMKSFLISEDEEALAKSDFVIKSLSDFLMFLL
ncbi:MAG: D-glycero-alpha-D-manno-heptose-1,7-bisphosphate 7-phosphatase [Chitinophagales bacterium]